MAEQMSAKDVVLKQLNRSRVTRVFGTPSEDATPRTLVSLKVHIIANLEY